MIREEILVKEDCQGPKGQDIITNQSDQASRLHSLWCSAIVSTPKSIYIEILISVMSSFLTWLFNSWVCHQFSFSELFYLLVYVLVSFCWQLNITRLVWYFRNIINEIWSFFFWMNGMRLGLFWTNRWLADMYLSY